MYLGHGLDLSRSRDVIGHQGSWLVSMKHLQETTYRRKNDHVTSSSSKMCTKKVVIHKRWTIIHGGLKQDV